MELWHSKGDGQYLIFAEWSKLPIEGFREEQDAKDFIKGFNKVSLKEHTCAYLRGLLYRTYFDRDKIDGYPFERYNQLSEVC